MSGLDSSLGVAKETVLGTFEAPTRHFEFLEEDIKLVVNRVHSAGLRSRYTKTRSRSGSRHAEGSFDIEVAASGTGILFEHALGAVATSGAGPYTHVFTPGPVNDKTLSLELSRVSDSGTPYVFQYNRGVVTSLALKASVNEYLMGTWSFHFQDENEGPNNSPTPGVYSTAWDPFFFTEGQLNLDGVDTCITDFSMTINNALKTDRFFICSTSGGTSKVPIGNGFREITGSIDLEFSDVAVYSKVKTGDLVPVTFTFANTNGDQLIIDMDVILNGDTPNVDGPELIEQTFNFEAQSDTSDADAITITLVNGDATP